MKHVAHAILVVATLVVAIPFPAGAGTDAEARRYEGLMRQAQELRQKAEHTRQDGNRAAAKSLDAKADAIENRAKGVEPANWPPAE